jgi:streptogramin lyase
MSMGGKTNRSRPLVLVAAAGLVLAAVGPVLHGSYALAAIGDITEHTIPTASSQPYDIVAGPDGNLWFTERNANKVGKVSTSGSFTEYTVPTANSKPFGIALGPDGNLWFTESVGNQIGKVTTSGVFTEYPIPTPSSSPWRITNGPDGNLWFTEFGAAQVAKLTTAGIFTEYAVGGNPGGIATGPDGNLWVTEFTGNNVAKVTSSGNVTEYPIPTSGSLSGGIVAGPDGNLWFTEFSGNKVANVTTSGSFTEYTVPTAGSQPIHLAAGLDGNIWFVELNGNKVARVTTSGAFTEYTVPTAGSSPIQITSGPDGNLWFVESNGNKVGMVVAVVAPTVTTQPMNQTVTAGATATFTAAASGTPAPTVQWQVSTGGPFSDLPGATSGTLTIPATTVGMSGNQYHAVFTNLSGAATSNAATLTVVPAPAGSAVTTQPANQTVTAGATATFTSAASGTPAPTVQWQVSTGGPFSDVPGATSGTLTIPGTTVGMSGNQYHAVFTNAPGAATSNAATLTVNSAPAGPTVTTQPTNQTVTAGATATFTSAASGTPAPTVQWQVSTGGPFSDVPGATSGTLTIPGTTVGLSGNQYHAVFTNASGAVTSNAATLTVNSAAAGPQPTALPTLGNVAIATPSPGPSPTPSPTASPSPSNPSPPRTAKPPASSPGGVSAVLSVLLTVPTLLVHNAPAIATRSSFPLLLLLMVAAFLGVQGRIDRRDPKLALAPVYPEPDLPFLPPGGASSVPPVPHPEPSGPSEHLGDEGQ